MIVANMLSIAIYLVKYLQRIAERKFVFHQRVRADCTVVDGVDLIDIIEGHICCFGIHNYFRVLNLALIQ